MPHLTDISKFDKSKYYFDEKAANSAVKYIENNINHVKGELAGQPLKLEKWQKEQIIKPIFGWKHKANGFRKHTSAYIEIPKKSGKSFLAAAMAAIFLDIEPVGGSETVGVAWGRKQAGLVFEATKEVIKKSPRLNKKCKIYRNSITAPDHLGGTKHYQILSKEAGGEDGINPQLAIIDELHVHKNNEVLEMVEKSQGARRQPLSFVITTAGSDLYGIGYQRHEYAKDVVDGMLIDETLLVCIHGAGVDDDPFDEKVWAKANPNYNVSIGKRAYEKEAQMAKASAASLNSFKRYYLNIWTSSLDGWIDESKWKANQWPIDEKILEGAECYGALDLASRSDITALTLIFCIEGVYITKNWFFLPEAKAKNSAEKNNIRYLDWVKQGYITETQGDLTDYKEVRKVINECAAKYKILEIAYDDWNAQHLVPDLVEDGFNLIEFRQGFKSMSSPTKDLHAYATSSEKKFNHLGNPVLSWMAGNAEVRVDDADNWKVVKSKVNYEKKVDGIITNIMALALWLRDKDEPKQSYLMDEDLYII